MKLIQQGNNLATILNQIATLLLDEMTQHINFYHISEHYWICNNLCTCSFLITYTKLNDLFVIRGSERYNYILSHWTNVLYFKVKKCCSFCRLISTMKLFRWNSLCSGPWPCKITVQPRKYIIILKHLGQNCEETNTILKQL